MTHWVTVGIPPSGVGLHESPVAEGVEGGAETLSLLAAAVLGRREEGGPEVVRRILEVRDAEADEADRANRLAVEELERLLAEGNVVSGWNVERGLACHRIEVRIP